MRKRRFRRLRSATVIVAVLGLVASLHWWSQASEPPEGKEPKMSAKEPTLVRHPGGAGFWYPADPKALADEVNRYMASAKAAEAPGKIVALVSPHAGYRFSGPVAGAAFKQVQGCHYDTVVVVGLSHRTPIRKATVFDGDAYETPLGRLPVDKEVAQSLLAQREVFEFNRSAHATQPPRFESGGEHSVENQVPFLQEQITGHGTL